MKKLYFILIIILLGIILYTPKYEEKEEPSVKYYNVNITGEVIRPGNYRVPEKTTYNNVVDMAGLTKKSVYLKSEEYIIKNTSINILKREKSININLASKLELMSIPGIGEKKAVIIIKYRKTKKIDDYLELKELLKVNNEKLLQIMAYTVIK